MIQIVQGRPPGATALLERMFADRRSLFVDLLGWPLPVDAKGLETDAFDDEHAVYVVAKDGGDHLGSLRLLHTDRPHLLDTLFARLCPFGIPTGKDVREITRLCLPQRLRAPRRLEIRNALIVAIVDHALASGVRRLTGVVEASFRRQVLAMGWLAEPLGPETMIDGSRLGAFALHIDATTPERLAWTSIAPSPPVLERAA